MSCQCKYSLSRYMESFPDYTSVCMCLCMCVWIGQGQVLSFGIPSGVHLHKGLHYFKCSGIQQIRSLDSKGNLPIEHNILDRDFTDKLILTKLRSRNVPHFEEEKKTMCREL